MNQPMRLDKDLHADTNLAILSAPSTAQLGTGGSPSISAPSGSGIQHRAGRFLHAAKFDISRVFDPTAPTAGGSKAVVLAHHRPPPRTGSQLFNDLSSEQATPVRWRISPHQPDGLQTRTLDSEQPQLLFLVDQTGPEIARFHSHGGLISSFGSIKAIKRLTVPFG